MADTLGSLCDKLTIVKLKQWHSEDTDRLASLAIQEKQLINEIDQHISAAVEGHIPFEKLSFPANKVHNNKHNDQIKVLDINSFGAIFSQLADANCALWHEQEKVYNFTQIPADQKDHVVAQLGILNLKRTNCIDEIDRLFGGLIKNKASNM